VPGFQPRPIGPAFDWVDAEQLAIRQGELQGHVFRLIEESTAKEFHLHLLEDDQEVGRCDIELNTQEATVVLWYITTQDHLRRHGLASILACTAFCRTLKDRKSASFAIRMLRLIKPDERVTKIQNVGIAVIARKLGFTSEFNLQELLHQENITMIELIPSDGTTPPGYRIVLKTLPYVLIAFLVDPETGRPLPGGHRLYESLVTPEAAEKWFNERMIVIGNGNSVLRRDGIREFVSRIALNEAEAAEFLRRIKPVSR
jgi:hypothetical protein